MKRLVVLLTLFGMAGCPAPAWATPGNAPGSQTGDAGGAFTGLAAAPEANLFTGVAQTSIPIEVPPGRLGLAPVLALSYSSSSGASVYGHGWSLPFPQIRRSTKHGVPKYDSSDRYVLEMPGAVIELEPVPGSAHGWRAEIESAFLRVGFDRGENVWKVIDKLGVSFVFGPTAATRTGRGPGTDHTFAWLLQRIEDPAGNRIELEYREDASGTMSSGQPRLIRYGSNANTGQPHFAEVRFEWADIGARARVSWRDGYGEVLDSRLSAIETWTHGLAARRYDFSHEEDPVTADLRLVGVTLTAFAEGAGDDVQLPSTVFVYAPAVHEGWPALDAAGDNEETYEIPMAGHLRMGRGTITADSVDLNGDARIDRIDANLRPPAVYLGTGTSFEPAGSWNWPTTPSAPRAVRKADGSGNLFFNVFDLDGDSFADLVDSTASSCGVAAGNWCVWRGSASGFASSATAWRSPVAQLRTMAGGGAMVVRDLVDMDADGRLDLVDATQHNAGAGIRHWNVYRNTGNGFASTSARFAAPEAFLHRTIGGGMTHGLFDINADSLPDFVVADVARTDSLRWGRLPYWDVHYNDGTGLAETSAQWPIEGGVGDGVGLPDFMSAQASDGTTIADFFDITGDGRPDLVRRTRGVEPNFTGVARLCEAKSRCLTPDVEDSAVSDGFCCFNLLVFVNTGSSFSQPRAWSSPAHGLRSDFDTCPYEDCYYLYDFDFFDIDGDGLVEFIQRFTAGLKPYSWIVHRHPASAAAGGTRPNLLVAMRNGIGGETLLRYRASADTPDTRLPFAHWVVTEREMHDAAYEQAPLRTSFAYRGGMFDPAERELRGFAFVQETDTAGRSRVREYHQDRRRAGRALRVTSLPPPHCPLTDASNADDPCSPWRRPLGAADYEWTVQGAVLLRSETDVPFHEGEAVENLRRTTTYAHDRYGNISSRRIETPMAATTTTATRFEHRVLDRAGGFPETYLVAKPVHVATTEAGRTSPLVERTFEYEWKAQPLASLTAASTCMEWTGPACSRWSRRSFEHERNGNMTVARAPGGSASRTDYDEHFLFAVRSTDPVGLVTKSVTDPRTGLVTETEAPNGNRLRSRYDGLGRLVRVWGPGTTKVAPLRRIEYAPGTLGDVPPRAVVSDAATGEQATFFDGLGRTVATKSQSRDGATPVALVTGLRSYDDRALVTAEALPFASDDIDIGRLTETFSDAPAWLEFSYDEAARLQATRSPDGSITRVDRSAPGIVRTDDANRSRPGFPGAVTLQVFDGLGRRVLEEACSSDPTPEDPYECPSDSLMKRESWDYDGLGRVTEMRTSGLSIAAGDSVTRIERDGLGNRSKVFHGNAGTWRFVSDDDGRTVEVHKPDGVVVKTGYDVAGRVKRRRGPSSRASYAYHSVGGGIGKVRRVSTRTRSMRVSEASEYDDRARIVTRERRVSVRGFDPAEIVVDYRYDDFDRRIGTSVAGLEGGSDVSVAWDDLGREISVSTDAHAYVVAADYDAEGRLRRTDLGNGLSDLVGYDERSNAGRRTGHLRCLRTAWTSEMLGSACDSQPGDPDALRYAAYDPNGNLLELVDETRADSDPLSSTRRYHYDPLGRLSRAELAGIESTFDFDPLGNLRRKGAVEIEYSDTERPSRISSVRDSHGDVLAYEYDAAGRRTSDGAYEYVYDEADRLVQLRVGGELETSYGYGDTGERIFVRHERDGTLEIELGDGIRLIGDELERTISFAGRPVAVERHPFVPERIRSGGRRARGVGSPERAYLHLDHQQSVRMTTDAGGRVVDHSRYEPFGERVGLFDASGSRTDSPATRLSFGAHPAERSSHLLFLGARHYDPVTGSFLTLDPAMQFASPYAYSDGNPVLGRDADGRVWEIGAIELLMIATGTATFIDSIVRTGDLGHSLTAGISAGFSVYLSNQLSTAVARPFARGGFTWLQTTAAVASSGFQALEAVEAIEDGRYAGGVVAAGMLAASLIGIESALDPGVGTTPEETQQRHGIHDRGTMKGRDVFDVNGVCDTRPGCATNLLVAARENLRVLFTGKAACVGGCDHVARLTDQRLGENRNVLLRCNSFGAIKCLGAIQQKGLAASLHKTDSAGEPRLLVEMSGAPLLRPPILRNVTYQVNLFDPVVWVGTAYSTPVSSDVTLGRNWWVPAPVIVHHTRMYERPFHEALGDVLP